MNARDLIESDFKILLTEVKKRAANIKDPVEKALKIISMSDPQQLQMNIDQILNPLGQVFESKSIKVFIPALNCLQKIASSIVISDAGMITILTMLKDASGENTDEMTQIKILQILLIFLNPNTLRLSKEFVDLVLQCSFQMFYSKSNSVKSTIQATLRQLFTLVFDKLVIKCKETAQNEDFFDQKRRFYIPIDERQEIIQRIQTIEGDIIFKVSTDLIATLARALAQQDQVDKKGQMSQTNNIWNLTPSIHSKCMIMDILCLILNQTQDVLQFFPPVLKIFDNELIPVLENMFKSKQPQEYIIGMRLMKLTILVINYLGIGVNLFSYILQETDNFNVHQKGKSSDSQTSMNLNWKSLIGFECVAIALNNPTLIKVFAQSALQVGKPVLIQVFESLISATDNLDISGDINQRHMQNPMYSQLKTPKFIEAQILENELPPPSPSQIHKLIVESICSFVENMILIFDQYGLKIMASKSPGLSNKNAGLASKMPISTQKQTMNDIDCKDLLLLSWKPLLMVLQNLLRLTQEESNIQMLLNSYQNFIGVCGSVQCYEPRDGFLESLCSFCLTEQVQTNSRQIQQQQKSDSLKDFVLTDKNVQICKTLLNIAHCLGYILDVKSWYIILETMQRIETVIKNRTKSKGKALAAMGNTPGQPMINASGNQTLVNFDEIKQKVQEKLKEYNMVERYSSIQKDGSKQRQMEEKKLSGQENAQEERKESILTQSRLSNAKRGSLQESGTKQGQQQHSRMNSTVQQKGSIQGFQDSANKNYNTASESTISSSQISHSSSHHQSAHSLNQSGFDSLNTDLQILQDSFDSLFTSSYMFDQQSLAELITSLGQLTVGVLENMNTNKKNTGSQISNSQVQDKGGVRGASSKHQPNEGDILANINSFALTRLVETALVNIHRIEQIWKILIAHFDILANCKVQTLRQLSIEALLCIILEIFTFRKDKKNLENKNPFSNQVSPMRTQHKQKNSISSSGDDVEQDMDFDVDENWSGTVWQYTILTPFSDQLKSQHQSNNLQTLNGIKKIIQQCGQQLKNDGWRIIILTISKSSEYIENDEILTTGFKCLQLIVSNYIDKLSQENFITILHAIHKYAANDGDNINNNLISVGMLQNIADYTAKMIVKELQIKEGGLEGNNNDEKVPQFNAQRIWSILFEKIQDLGNNHRSEIRRANIFTLENIIMTHGQLLSDQVWNTLLRNSLLNMLKTSIDMFMEQKGGSQQKAKPNFMEAGLPTPSFSSGGWETSKRGGKSGAGGAQARRMKFDEEAVKALQKNNDEQWEETCVLLVQLVLRSIKKYTQLDQRTSELTDHAWINSIQVINEMIRNGSQEICSTIYKSLEDLLTQSNCIDLFMNNIKESFKIFEATSDWLIREKQDTGGIVRKPMNLKLCPIIIETLKKIYCQENLQENAFRAPYLQIIIPTYAQIVYQLLFRMMKCSKNSSDGFQGMGVPHKLVNEEKITFEFIENLNDIVRRNDQTHLQYLKFLLQFTEYDYQEPHSEAFIRRTFSILNSIILRGKVANHILREILPQLYDRIEFLINLRYNNEACMALVFPSKGSQTLFYTVGLYAMHISSFLVNPKSFKQRMTAHYKSTQEQQRVGPGGVFGSNVNASSNVSGGVGSGNVAGAGSGSTGGGFTGLKSKLTQNMGSNSLTSAEDFITSNDIMFSEQLEFSIVDPAVIHSPPQQQDPEIKQLVWERVIPLARNNLLFNPERVANHNKAVVEDVVKSSQDLDMQVMNFITNSLLPNCSDANDREFTQQNLVYIIDNGCNSVYSSQRLSQGSSSNSGGGAFGNSLSKFCLNNLFELCRFQLFKTQSSLGQQQQQQDQNTVINEIQDQQDLQAQRKIYEIRRKIATTTTPVLINRCRDTLKKYVTDEQKSGSTTLARQRVSEVVFILEKLRQLDCYPEVQPQQYKSKKGHLVQLMPIFADLVLSNETSLKEHLRLIFHDISEAIATTMSQGHGDQDEEHKVGDSSGGF